MTAVFFFRDSQEYKTKTYSLSVAFRTKVVEMKNPAEKIFECMFFLCNINAKIKIGILTVKFIPCKFFYFKLI